jgi:hypothetical protein
MFQFIIARFCGDRADTELLERAGCSLLSQIAVVVRSWDGRLARTAPSSQILPLDGCLSISVVYIYNVPVTFDALTSLVRNLRQIVNVSHNAGYGARKYTSGYSENTTAFDNGHIVNDGSRPT